MNEVLCYRRTYLPIAVDVVNIIGESTGKLILKMALSTNTISRRIQEMAKVVSIN